MLNIRLNDDLISRNCKIIMMIPELYMKLKLTPVLRQIWINADNIAHFYTGKTVVQQVDIPGHDTTVNPFFCRAALNII